MVPVLVVPCSPALPIQAGTEDRPISAGEGSSWKCLGAPSPPTPLNGYTSTLLCRHSCRHGRSSIRLQAIHMHHCERLVSFPAHDDPSSIQYFGDEHRAKPRELQLRSPSSFQRYVVNPYQLSSLLHGTAGEGCRADRPGRPTGAAIPVPPTCGTVGAVLCLPGITIPTGAIAPWPTGRGCLRSRASSPVGVGT